MLKPKGLSFKDFYRNITDVIESYSLSTLNQNTAKAIVIFHNSGAWHKKTESLIMSFKNLRKMKY